MAIASFTGGVGFALVKYTLTTVDQCALAKSILGNLKSQTPKDTSLTTGSEIPVIMKWYIQKKKFISSI